MPSPGSCKCLHCHTFFKPNPQSKGRQKYCSHVDCKKASKRASQQKWLNKPENRDYFRGTTHVQRVQQWRTHHPGYWIKSTKPSHSDVALQETLITQDIDLKNKSTNLKDHALQELLTSQPSVLIGLIAHLTGTTLQDDIVSTGQKLRQLGEDFLHKPNLNKGEYNEYSSLTQSKTVQTNTASL